MDGGVVRRRAAVFLDRDGTLIQEADYLADPDGVVLIEGVIEALRRLRAAGFTLVVVTNQSGIARGLYDESDYRAVAARLDRVLEAAGVAVDATYHCPHHPDHSGACECRKPGLGMHRRAARDLGLDLRRSVYVGDKLTDVLPAEETGGRGYLVRTGYGGRVEPSAVPEGVEIVDDLSAAVDHILALTLPDSPD